VGITVINRSGSLIPLIVMIGCIQGPGHVVPRPAAATLVLAHVNVVDMANGYVVPQQTVIVAGSRIRTIASASEIDLPPGVRIIDGTDKYLIPGLWDMHVHIPGQNAFEGFTGAEFLPVYVALGVTGVRDMGADCAAPDCERWMRNPGDIDRWRAAINAGALPGPRIVSPGPIVDGPVPVHRGSLAVSHPDSARSLVRQQVARRAPFIKVYDRIPRDAYFALADEARRQRIPFAGHVPTSVSAMEASDAGQHSLEHLWLVLDGCSGMESELLVRRRARVAAVLTRDTTFPFAVDYQDLTARTLATFDPNVCRALADRFRRNGTWLAPTNAGTWGDAMAGDSAFTRRAEYAGVPAWLKELLSPYAASNVRRSPEVSEQRRRWHYRKLDVVGLMHGQGVRLLAGTDNPGAHTYPGFSIHDELALLVRAGLSPLEALRSATLNPAQYLNAADSLGQVAPGYLADLVLLDANPLIDIQNTRRIFAVVLNGRHLDSSVLERILSVPLRDVPDRR
jgi:imidazolonepropionase-like amidohydrolase